MRILLIAAALGFAARAVPAAALEPEYENSARHDALSACARGAAGSLLVPQLRSKGSERRIEGLERVMRWRLLKTAEAVGRLTRTDCALFSDPAARASFEGLLSTIDAASKRGIEEFMRKNGASYDLSWETEPMARLTVELSTVTLRPGRYSEVCRPPAVFTEVDAPFPPADATAEEKKTYADMAEKGERLRVAVLGEIEAFQDVLKALEGSDCLETVQAFDRMVSDQRWAFLRHRDAELGGILRGRLKWRKLGD